jgi:hypothetical protein
MWHAQVITDELPMLFAASLSLYILLVKDGPDVSQTQRLVLKLELTALPVTISAIW